jgi:hypothetical protein
MNIHLHLPHRADAGVVLAADLEMEKRDGYDGSKSVAFL